MEDLMMFNFSRSTPKLNSRIREFIKIFVRILYIFTTKPPSTQDG